MPDPMGALEKQTLRNKSLFLKTFVLYKRVNFNSFLDQSESQASLII